MAKKRKNRKFLAKMKLRLLISVGVFFCIFAILVIRLIYINAKTGKEYEQRVLKQQTYSSTVVPFKRGDILDVNGSTLATTKKVYNLILEPKNILEKENQRAATVKALKDYFGMTDAEIGEALSNKDSYYYVAKKKLEYEVVKPFKDFWNSDAGDDVVGIVFEEEYVRIYPNNELACHLLGFTVSGNVGMYGVEESYNDVLNGSNGRQHTYLNDDFGLTKGLEAPVNGYNVVTSIDANVQKIVQEKVDAYMASEGASNVSVLVMDPTNSNVMALYNSHSFDPNDAYDMKSTRYQFASDAEYEAFLATASDAETVDALNKVWRNFVISDAFEPGSTYKTFTISGALQEGVVSPTDSFFCDGGQQVDTYYIQCHAYNIGGHGAIDLSGALENSCNDALMQIAYKEGAKTFDKYQTLFGFGQNTNIDIPGEPGDDSLSTVIYHEDTLNETELATSSFGQGVCASMIEIGTAFCSVINGGRYYEPSVAQKIVDENGNIIDNLDSVLVRRTVSEEVSEIMRDELFQVVERGTGRKAAVEGYTIGGKTGTAEKLPRGNGKYLISFIGFAPVEDPKVVIYVVVDEPHTDDQSSSAASSYIFADIAKALFPYLNIYKNNDNYDLDNSDAVDEIATPIYDGEVPANDVAGGEDNPYVAGAEEAGENQNSDEEGSEDGSDEDYYYNEDNDGYEDYEEEYYEEEYYDEEY